MLISDKPVAAILRLLYILLPVTHADDPRYLRFAPAICIGLLLLFTFRLYSFAYFWLDDFHNLHWIRQWSVLEGIWHVFSPSTEYFRPVGMLVYQIAFYLFDRDPRLYHWLMWSIHALNVGIVYVVLKRFTESRAGAAAGALLFANPPVFNDIFWSFGTIFELTSAPLFFAGMLVWQRKSRSVGVVLAATGTFLLALKAKEMAITLPAIWALQDLLLRRPLKVKEVAAVALPGLVGVWFGLQKVTQMATPGPTEPYYIDLRGIVMGRGFGYYFNTLFGTDWRWQVWSIGFVTVLLILLALRLKLAAFFQAYVFVTFLPLIFMLNHRDPFYWYFPMLGVCGLSAVLVKAVTEKILVHVPSRRLAPYASAAFALLCVAAYVYSSSQTEERRLQQHGIAANFRGFVESMEALPPPAEGETLFFDSMPEYFDPGDTLLFAAELALRREDITTRFVEKFPPDARYRLSFENSRVIRH